LRNAYVKGHKNNKQEWDIVCTIYVNATATHGKHKRNGCWFCTTVGTWLGKRTHIPACT